MTGLGTRVHISVRLWNLLQEEGLWRRNDEGEAARAFSVGCVYPQDRQEVGVYDTKGRSVWPQWGEVQGHNKRVVSRKSPCLQFMPCREVTRGL